MSRTCFDAATATSGAQGLAANAVTAGGLGVRRIDCPSEPAGIGGGPAGRPRVIETRLTSLLGLLTITVLLPDVSGAPSRIHLRIVSKPAAGIGPPCGGIIGSALWAASRNNRLSSGSPGFTTTPELPPAMSLT